jgi:hypothetical protein
MALLFIKNILAVGKCRFFIEGRAIISRNSPNSNIKNKDIFPLNNN